MAQYRQSGFDRFAGRSHDPSSSNSSSLGNGAISDDHVSIGIRNSHKQPHHRARRFGHKPGARRISMGTAIVLFCLVLAVTALVYVYISRDNTDTNDADTLQYDDFKNDFLTNVTRISTSEVKFGHGSVLHGRDSRYWDGDDRRRDEDYDGQAVDKIFKSHRDEPENSHPVPKGRSTTKDSPHSIAQGTNRHGLYNEAGRNELKIYEERYEASLKDGGHQRGADSGTLTDGGKSDMDNDEIDMDDEYDDGIDSHDARLDDYEEKRHDTGEMAEGASSDSSLNTTIRSQVSDNPKAKSEQVKSGNGRSTRTPPRRRPRHHKYTPPCQLKFSNSTSHLVEPVESRRFARFSLQYTVTEDKPDGVEHWEPRFAGHQSLREREESFMARDQKINCGFVKGPSGYPSTGFDLDEDDARYISKCHIAVVSCIFGNSDRLRSPIGNTVSRSSRKNVCFVMFMDEKTLQTVSSEGQMPDRTGFIGFWKIVVVKNLPYDDMRRVGKIPKLLSHRLFPSARYSIWLDSKLRLQRDPILILEHFLWRKKYEYAISNHYSRHCVWEEVAQNKRLNKYNHTIIDQQFAFYQADGLKRFNASDPHKLLPSNVPEGSFIIRAHTPLSNLFSCLWFNEVDRFTPRDQLSFAHTYHKLRKKNPGKPFYLNMFKDCERRAIAKLYHHRSEEKRTVVQETAE